MTGSPADGGSNGDGNPVDDAASDGDWPVDLTGVTETIVTTLGPNGRWNAAALGLFAPTEDDDAAAVDLQSRSVMATTWGNTRTRRNFHRQGGGYVQFTRDPVAFVDAALSIWEVDEPVLDAADAWVRIEAQSVETGVDDGTVWERWTLTPRETRVRRTRVPTIDRGFAAVVEASVLTSRLGVPGYDEAVLRDRLGYCASVVDRAGGPRDREALGRIGVHAGVDLDDAVSRAADRVTPEGDGN